MSRSRKLPFHSITCIGLRAGIQSSWKKSYNRHFRRNVKPTEDGEISETNYRKKPCADIWLSPSDGKSFWRINSSDLKKDYKRFIK